MKFGYTFSNLLGTVYKQGNLVFTSDGNTLLSPVGNRVSVFDLVNNKSSTLPFETRKNVFRMALSPNDVLLLVVDEEGYAQLVNFARRTVLHYFNFKDRVECLKFSPDGKYFAAAVRKHIQVWRAPGLNREFAPFVLHRTYTGHFDDVLSVDWSPDSKFFTSAARDMTAKVYSIDPTEGFTPLTLSAHRDYVVGAFFGAHSLQLYTVSKDGAVVHWEQNEEDAGKAVDENGVTFIVPTKFRLVTKHFVNRNATKTTTCAYNRAGRLLTLGFSTGLFALYEMPDFTLIHTLSISQKRINACVINPSGEWLAFGSARLGQLLVWEWKSETHVLKQQGHFHDTAAIAYSPDGQSLTTGGDDGKVKVWDTNSGFCYVTFREHTAGIVGVEYNQQKNGVVFTASLDGTVRAYDLVRYRNFRTFTGPTPVRFNSLAVELSGEIVCAGTSDTNEILVWSVQTGRLLEIIAGHQAPVSGLSFSPIANQLASGSWDQSVRVWDLYSDDRGHRGSNEGLVHKSDVLALAYRPDGRQLVVATLDGQLSFWDVQKGANVASIDGRRDAMGGRRENDSRKGLMGGHFSSVCYNADGTLVLAGGRSRFVCIYSATEYVLIRRFEITHNRSMDGVLDQLNSKNMSEAGNIDLIDAEDSADSDHDDTSTLPGVSKGSMSERRVKPEVGVRCVRFAPTGRAWAAATTEGLLVYSLDATFVFDPYNLDVDVTPDTIRNAAASGDHTRAICLSFRLGEQDLIHKTVEHCPATDIALIVAAIPQNYLPKLLQHLSSKVESSPHIQFYVNWVREVLNIHGRYIMSNQGDFGPVLRALVKTSSKQFESLSKMCEQNTYLLSYLKAISGSGEFDEVDANEDIEMAEQ